MEWLVIDLYLGDDLGRVARRVRSPNVWFKAYRESETGHKRERRPMQLNPAVGEWIGTSEVSERFIIPG